MIIYKVTNIINGKVYIGQTINTLEYRRSQHFRETKSDKKKNTYFHNAIAKYGEENFIFEQIDSSESIDELNLKEQYWIDFYNATNEKFGYNLDSGGKNCLKSDSTKQKIGEKTKERWNDQEIAKAMLEGLSKGTTKWIEMCKENRETFICPVCGKSISLCKYEIKNKQYCSMECMVQSGASREYARKASNASAIKSREIHNRKRKEIAEFIYSWCNDNKEIILSCPLNKVSTHLYQLMNIINEKYDLKDIRSLYPCFNVKNSKDLANCLKDYVLNENIC